MCNLRVARVRASSCARTSCSMSVGIPGRVHAMVRASPEETAKIRLILANWSQSHTPQALKKTGVRAQVIPLRPHRQIHQAWIAAIDGAFQMLKGGVQVSDFGIMDGQLHRRERLGLARSAVDKQPGQTGPSSACVSFSQAVEGGGGNPVRLGVSHILVQPPVEIAFLQVGARKEFPRMRMSEVECQSL